jgi:hypothetical protein
VVVGLLLVIFNTAVKTIIGIFFSPFFSVTPSLFQSGYSSRVVGAEVRVPASSRPSRHNGR